MHVKTLTSRVKSNMYQFRSRGVGKHATMHTDVFNADSHEEKEKNKYYLDSISKPNDPSLGTSQ